jgi:hypothetical protein
VFTEPFTSTGRLFFFIENLLPSNENPSVVCSAAPLPKTNGASEPFASNGRFSGSTILALNKFSTIFSFAVKQQQQQQQQQQK